jgi:hypothetical protein
MVRGMEHGEWGMERAGSTRCAAPRYALRYLGANGSFLCGAALRVVHADFARRATVNPVRAEVSKRLRRGIVARRSRSFELRIVSIAGSHRPLPHSPFPIPNSRLLQ